MALHVTEVGWADPDATRLRDAQQAELRDRYGEDDIGHDMAGEDIVAMVLVRDGGEAVACGALRDATADLGPGTGELKRMYVVPSARGRGLSRTVVTHLERVAADLAWTRLVLETGVLQPEAIGVYLGAGYAAIPSYGEYVDEATSRCFAKDLPAAGDGAADPVDDLTAEAGDRAAVPAVAAAPSPAAEPAPAQGELEVLRSDWAAPEAAALRRRFSEDGAARYPELFAHLLHGPAYEAYDEREGEGVLDTFLALLDGVPVGCASLRAARPGQPAGSGELKKVFVDPAARGRGVARALVRAVEDAARGRGLTQVLLLTGIRQPEAVRLYRSEGYRPVLPFTDPDGDFLSLWFGKVL